MEARTVLLFRFRSTKSGKSSRIVFWIGRSSVLMRARRFETESSAIRSHLNSGCKFDEALKSLCQHGARVIPPNHRVNSGHNGKLQTAIESVRFTNFCKA